MIKVMSWLSLTVLFLNALSHAEDHKTSAWVLDPAKSKIAYGSIKKNTVGEVNAFERLKGHIDPKGNAFIEIDLTSVNTLIDIRNERMLEYIFNGIPKAKLSAKVPVSHLAKLAVGESAKIDLEGSLRFGATSTAIETRMFVVKISPTKLLATSDSMIMLNTEAIDVNTGIDKLQEIAKLSGITRVAPVTLRLMFDAGSAVAIKHIKPAVDDKITGIVPGKKVFLQCKACHSLKSPSNGIGPHLMDIIGRKAGSAEGFAYSKAIKQSGITWTKETLTLFLEKPMIFLPGNKMPYPGLKSKTDISNLLAYLESISKKSE